MKRPEPLRHQPWTTSLELDELELAVHLGCEAEERAHTQTVLLSARIQFSGAPHGCSTDQLVDTVCYAELADTARRVVASREFRLVEHLGSELLGALRRALPETARLDLDVHKVAPPVSGLRGGVHFRCSG